MTDASRELRIAAWWFLCAGSLGCNLQLSCMFAFLGVITLNLIGFLAK
jgi:hypothetical protein